MKLVKYLLERQRELTSITDQSPELQAQIDLLDEILVYAKLQNVDINKKVFVATIHPNKFDELDMLNGTFRDIIKSGGIILDIKHDLSEGYFVSTVEYILDLE